jgi:hypothetical protein
MQQDADFITADFLYMFRASRTHHQEYKIPTWQPPVQVVIFAGGSSLCHIRDRTVSSIPNMAEWGSTCEYNYLYRRLPYRYFILLMMGASRPKHEEKVCRNKNCILSHHVGVLFKDTCESEVCETASHEMKNTLQISNFNLHLSMLVLWTFHCTQHLTIDFKSFTMNSEQCAYIIRRSNFIQFLKASSKKRLHFHLSLSIKWSLNWSCLYLC